MVELEAHVASHLLHTGFHVIFEVFLPAKELRNFTAVKDYIRAE